MDFGRNMVYLLCKAVIKLSPEELSVQFCNYTEQCKTPNRTVIFYVDYSAQVGLESGEICSRIIGKIIVRFSFHISFHMDRILSFILLFSGRCGWLVKFIRTMTKAKITSPKLNKREGNTIHSSNIFIIEAQNEFTMKAVALIILLLADYFKATIVERLTLQVPGHICVQVPVPFPHLVLSNLLRQRGQYVVELGNLYNVRIVSPKPYSIDCNFHIIGEPVSIILIRIVSKQNNDFLHLYLKYTIISYYHTHFFYCLGKSSPCSSENVGSHSNDYFAAPKFSFIESSFFTFFELHFCFLYSDLKNF